MRERRLAVPLILLLLACGRGPGETPQETFEAWRDAVADVDAPILNLQLHEGGDKAKISYRVLDDVDPLRLYRENGLWYVDFPSFL